MKIHLPLCHAGRRLLGRFLFVIGLVLLWVYVSSYYYLSRRGMREAQQFHVKGFLYVTVKEGFNESDLSRHCFRARLYAPLNQIDQVLFGGDGPVRGVTWGLNK